MHRQRRLAARCRRRSRRQSSTPPAVRDADGRDVRSMSPARRVFTDAGDRERQAGCCSHARRGTRIDLLDLCMLATHRCASGSGRRCRTWSGAVDVASSGRLGGLSDRVDRGAIVHGVESAPTLPSRPLASSCAVCRSCRAMLRVSASPDTAIERAPRAHPRRRCRSGPTARPAATATEPARAGRGRQRNVRVPPSRSRVASRASRTPRRRGR